MEQWQRLEIPAQKYKGVEYYFSKGYYRVGSFTGITAGSIKGVENIINTILKNKENEQNTI